MENVVIGGKKQEWKLRNIGLKPEIDCPYEDVCTRYPSESCKNCKHNRKRKKRDYYKPDEPKRPRYPPYPYPPCPRPRWGEPRPWHG